MVMRNAFILHSLRDGSKGEIRSITTAQCQWRSDGTGWEYLRIIGGGVEWSGMTVDQHGIRLCSGMRMRQGALSNGRIDTLIQHDRWIYRAGSWRERAEKGKELLLLRELASNVRIISLIRTWPKSINEIIEMTTITTTEDAYQRTHWCFDFPVESASKQKKSYVHPTDHVLPVGVELLCWSLVLVRCAPWLAWDHPWLYWVGSPHLNQAVNSQFVDRSRSTVSHFTGHSNSN